MKGAFFVEFIKFHKSEIGSVLSRTQERYIEFFFHFRAGKKLREIADMYDLTVDTVERGLTWCRKQRIGDRDKVTELEKHIRDAKDDINQLERDTKKVRKWIRDAEKGDKPVSSAWINALNGLHRTLREQKQYLAELEGIYKTVVSVVGADGGPVKVEYEVVDPDDQDQ
jgi:predicted RNase H-like nuclease (RuvC/YqgF family)